MNTYTIHLIRYYAYGWKLKKPWAKVVEIAACVKSEAIATALSQECDGWQVDNRFLITKS